MSDNQLKAQSGASATALDWQYGYTASAGDVTMVGISAAGEVGLCGRPVLTGQDVEADSSSLAYGSQKIRETAHEQVVFVSHGGAHAQMLVAAAADTGTGQAVHLEHSQMWARTREEWWEHLGEIPDVSDQMISSGYQPPQPSREDRQQALTSQPPVAPLPPASASALDQTLPGTRIGSGLTSLAELTGGPDPGTRDAHVAIAAHCIASDPIVRDGVAAEASRTPAGRVALIETFRSAPAGQQPGCAAAAAMAMHFNGSSSLATQIVADHAAGDATHGSVAQMAAKAADSGLYGPDVRAHLDAQFPEALEAAERVWQQQRDITAQFTTAQMQRHTAPVGPGL